VEGVKFHGRSQKEKFIAAAKAHGADETGETFLRTFKTVAKAKK
jgi:hypothetical protein